MSFVRRQAPRFYTGLFFVSLLAVPSLASAQARASAAVNPAATTSTAPDHAESYYHYGLAKMYEQQAVQSGRQDLASQAIEQYKLALDADPDSRTLADGLANLYLGLGRVREAVTAAKAQVARHPDDVAAHTLLGRTYLRSLGNGKGQQSAEVLQAAIGEYETIEKLQPKDLETHLLLGQLYSLNHDSAKAEAEFKTAQSIDPTSEDVVLSIARLYTEHGEMQKAAQVIANVPADDRTERMNFALAGIDEQLKKPKEAAEAYRAVLSDDPDNADARKGLAQALMQSGDTEAAAKVYAEILKTDPQDPQALIRQSEIERRDGKYEDALATLKKAEELAPDNLELQYNEGLVYDALGRFDDAAKMFKQALDASNSPEGKYSDADKSNRALFMDRLANVYREQDKTDDAIAVYKQMEAMGGDYAPRAVSNEVDTYREAHQWAAALKAAADAAKAMPKNRDIQLSYASQLADSGKVDEAVKLANAQLSAKGNTPEDRAVYYTVANIYVRAKRWKDAMAEVEKAEASSTQPADKAFFYYFRGHVADLEKMYDQAEADFRKGLEIQPDSPVIENDYGYMLAERGVRLDEAVAMLKKAVDSDPQNAAYLDSLAWAYYKQGQYALAENFERKAVRRQGTDPTLLDHLGEIEAKNGKLQDAVNDWQKSLELYANSLSADADPADVRKVQSKLESARVKLAKLNGNAK